jgi:hypothetical protein
MSVALILDEWKGLIGRLAGTNFGFTPMLRITQSQSAQAAKNYFGECLRRGDYYAGKEIAGNWGGKGAKLLGINGPVREEEFCGMLDNIRPDGRRLTVRTVENRRPGYDFTFDVPKSVSLLHSIGGDKRIETAMKKALDETMLEIETEMHTRVRKGGAQEDRRTGNMIWADFLHLTSRPAPLDEFTAGKLDGRLIRDNKGTAFLPDPHLHVHVYVVNATYDAEERLWKAGVFMQAKRDAMYFQAAYHARLAAELQKLGYHVEPTANAFEIRDVSRALIDPFSRRTKEVEETAEALGITSAKAKDKLGARTRHAKDDSLDAETLFSAWETMAGSGEVAHLKKIVRIAKEDAEGRAVDSPAMAIEAVNYAIAKELERSSEVSERRVLASALEKAVGAASVASVETALATRKDVLRATIGGEKRMTTIPVLREEDRLMRFIRDGKGTVAPFCRKDYHFHNPLFVSPLAHEQRVAVEAFMASNDWVWGLIGRAGTGKTTLLKEIRAGLDESGTKLVAVAPTAEAARGVLRQEGFASADTVKRLLVDGELQKTLKGNVLWVDEAGMLGNRDMLDLMAVAKSSGARKVVLAGDPTQIRSVPRGDALRFMEENAGLKVARLQTIQRQKNPKLREAVDAISRAEMNRGLSLIDKDKGIIEGTRKEAHDALAKTYAERVKARRNVLVISPTHSEGEKITTAIRRELKGIGNLGAEERTLTQIVNQNWTEPEKSRAAAYEMGMVVEFKKGADGFARHERASVVDVDAREGTVRVLRNNFETHKLPLESTESFDVYRKAELPVSVGERLRITQNGTVDGHRFDNGNTVKVKALKADGLLLENGARLPADFGHLAHGYVSTADAAQSKTVDSVLIGIGGDSMDATDMRRMYVAVSRARHEARIFTDDKEGLFAAAERDTERRFGSELVGTSLAQRIIQEDIQKELDAKHRAERTLAHRQITPPQREHGIEIERTR